MNIACVRIVLAKKPTKTGIGLQLDKVEREICLLLADYKCQRCGTDKYLSWAHIVQRGRKALKWDRNNSLILCYKAQGDAQQSCHYWFDRLTTDHTRYQFVNKLKPDVYRDHLDAQVGLNFGLTIKNMLLLLELKKDELKELKELKDERN